MRRTLFDLVIMLDNERSAQVRARSSATQSTTVALRWSCVIEHDIRWWNSVLLTANLGNGSFFLSRVVVPDKAKSALYLCRKEKRSFRGPYINLKSFCEHTLLLSVCFIWILSRVNSLGPCCHLLYTFQDVSSYHSNAVSEVAADGHAYWSIECKIDQLGTTVVASFLVRFSKTKYLRLDNEEACPKIPYL